MIERAGHHFHASPRLFIERPVTCIVTMQVRLQRRQRILPKLSRAFVGRGEREVVNSPTRPQEAVQYVRWWRNDVFLDPPMSVRVSEDRSAFRYISGHTFEAAHSRIEISGVAGLGIRAHQERNSLPLREPRIRRRTQRRTVFEIEMVLPNPEAPRILLASGAEPVGGLQKSLAPARLG